MSKSIRSLILVLLSAVFVVQLCACGSGSTSIASSAESASGEDTASVSSAEISAEEAEPAEEEETGNPSTWVTDEKVTLTYWLNYTTDTFTLIDSYADNLGFQKAEELTNVHIDFIEVFEEQQTEQFHIMVASGDWPDLMQNFGMLYVGGAVAGYNDGVIMDFSDLAETCLPNYLAFAEQDEETSKAIVTDDDMMLSLYTFYREYLDGPLNGMVIRQDWLDELGLDVPSTYDELHDVLTAFKSEKGAVSPLYLIDAGAYENGALTSGFNTAVYINTEGDGTIYPFYQEDGVVKYGPMEEGFTEYITMMNQWLNEGLINRDFTTATANPMDDQFVAAVTTNETGYFNVPSMMLDMLEEMIDSDTADLEPIPDVGMTADQEFALGWLPRNYNTAGISIASTCSIPEIALKWEDFFYSEEGSWLATYGVEGESFEIVNGTPTYTDAVLNSSTGYSGRTMLTLYTVTVDALRDTYLGSAELMTEKAWIAGDIWGTRRTGEGELPINISMTTEETESFNTYFGDICTYCQEMIAKFINGDEPLENIPAFQQRLVDMGINTCIEMKQAALNRYNER